MCVTIIITEEKEAINLGVRVGCMGRVGGKVPGSTGRGESEG